MSDHESCPRFYSDASGSRRESDALVHIGFLNELWSHPAEKSSLTPLLQRGKAALAAGGFFPFPQLEPDRYIDIKLFPRMHFLDYHECHRSAQIKRINNATLTLVFTNHIDFYATC
ncbi:MAG: hypothetical protein ACOYMW_09800 [Candidatus Competibacteraceae bacterium]